METPSCKIPGMFQGQEGDNQVRTLSPSEAAVKEDLRLRKGNPGSEEDGLGLGLGLVLGFGLGLGLGLMLGLVLVLGLV